ncbi:hypothetical protein AURDEDRAFT_116946 [Auricularia subglabra TFB-10046 SS5]|uniref:F-box domain-containing protein n=1 Tax=Auricularia subglabra (strain TFB-10046 / SS5) TaxID=717982 RepID=J0WV88_AURST|nr:hypothetical protein AURDEDRAFT_116946 [Auricularia subglabra TFB-10046 SS5]
MALPPELVEQIIDDLAGDRLGLLACSVVAQVWRPRALSHLFRSIRIRQPGLTRNAVGGLIPVTPCEFTELRKRSPQLLLYVRNLVISVENPYLPLDELLHFLRSVSFPLPCTVTTLKIAAIGPVEWGDGLFDNFADRFPACRRVEVDTEELFPLVDIAKALSLAQELVLHAPSLYRESMPLSIVHLLPVEHMVVPTLSSLTLFNDPLRLNRQFFAYVSCLYACAANIASIAVRDITLHTLETFVLSSNTFSGRIRELKLVLAAKTYLKQEHIDAALAHCTNLRVLEIDVQQESFASVQLVAPSAPHPQLEALRFTYRGLPSLYADSLPPAAWDDWVLASSQIRSVSFTFVVSDGRDSDWCERIGELAKGVFSQTHSSGKLEWHVEHK